MPHLFMSAITDRVYYASRVRDLGEGKHLVMGKKVDVTEDFERLTSHFDDQIARLTRERDALLSAAKAACAAAQGQELTLGLAMRLADLHKLTLDLVEGGAEDKGHCDACGKLSADLGGAINPICTDGQFCPECRGLEK